MRRPPLTRKKIESIKTCIMLAEGYVEDHDGHLAEEEKQVREADEFVRQLSRWHKWKQQQKEQEIIDAVLASIATELANNN